MNRNDLAELYFKCWAEADAGAGTQALAENFVFHNPRAGNIGKRQFEAYFAELVKMVDARREGPSAGPFMEFSDRISEDDGTTLTTWVWWRIRGTVMEGSGLLKTTDSGVVSHHATYYATPQWDG